MLKALADRVPQALEVIPIRNSEFAIRNCKRSIQSSFSGLICSRNLENWY
jgi:hypothetical protein